MMTRQQLLFVTSAGQGLAAASDQLTFGKTLALGFHLLPQACSAALPACYQLQEGSDCTGWSGRTAAVLDKQALSFGPVFKLSRHCCNGFTAQLQARSLQLHNSRTSAGANLIPAGQVASFASSSAIAAEPAAAAPHPPSSSSSSSSSVRQQLEQQQTLQPPWLGFDIDVAGFSKKGYMRGGGKEQNQDRGLIMQQFRSPGEMLLGVMDGHGTFGHLVSTFLIQHLPALLMQQLVAAAAAGLALQGSSNSSGDWRQQPPGKRHSKQQQQQQQPAPQHQQEMMLGLQLPYVVIPDHSGEAGSPAGYASAAEGAAASVASSGKHARARLGRAVSKHKVAPQPEHAASYDLQDGPGSSSSSSSSGNSSSRRQKAPIAVPKALVDQEPICQSLLTAVFAETDCMLIGSGINTMDSGSTALLCHVGHDSITTAWVGDSRAVLGRRVTGPKAVWDLRLQRQQQQRSSVSNGGSGSSSGGARWQAIPLSDDHKPERPDEQLRIVLNDGRVQQMTDRSGKGVGPFRVWFKQLDYPGLAMSRAFGDTPCRRIGVTVEPELYVHRLTPQDELLVVASDGVWEYLSNEQVVEIAGRAGSAESAARRVVEAAEAAWRAVDGGQYVDDITAVVVRAAACRDGGGGGALSKL